MRLPNLFHFQRFPMSTLIVVSTLWPSPVLLLFIMSKHLNMAIPQHQFQNNHHQQQATQLRNLSPVDNQLSAPTTFYNSCNFGDQSYPQYIPPFHVVGLAPGPVPVPDAFDGGGDLRWGNGSEIPHKRLKEQDFLENNNTTINNNNSQISSVDFLQSRSVSTGLGLSIDDRRLASSGESPVFSLFNDDIDLELQRQDAEIDHFVKVQGERLRRAILEKVQANQIQTISLAEERILQKIREKEAEVEGINKKNMELEEQMEQLAAEVGTWQHRATCNENMINTLKFNIRQVLVQNRDSKEGCGDSEVDDTASCCNSGAIDFHLIGKENKDLKGSMTCKVCKVNQVCMVLLPCRHLCLCKDCESKLGFCPLCQSSKLMGMEIFM